MKKDFIEFYNNELYYLREMAELFAEENPQIASNLGIEGFTCSDPYVERLLEGFAFLAARVHYQLDSDFSKFTHSLINNIYPDYHMPFPSASVVKFNPDYMNEDIINGITIPRNTILNSLYRSKTGTTCTFSTSYDVTLWPITLERACYSVGSAFTEYSFNNNETSKAFLSLKLKSVLRQKFSDLATDELDFYLCSGSMKVLMRLYEQLFTDTISIIIQFTSSENKKYRIQLGDVKNQLLPLGFDNDQSLLPYSLRTFQGYRLLREYFVYPKKFLFFRLAKLQDAFKQIDSDEVEIFFVFNRDIPLLETSISKKNISLYSTPVINFFPKRLDRFSVNDKKTDILLNAEKTKQNDFEIISIENIEGYNPQNSKTVVFKPFYQTSEYDSFENKKHLYYDIRRKLVTSKNNFKKGTDTFISLVDIHSLYSTNIVAEIGISALCSNRWVPLEIPITPNTKTDFTMNEEYPVTGIKLIERPSKPEYSNLKRPSEWVIINHLKVNYKYLMDGDNNKNLEILKTLLKLYGQYDKLKTRKQIDGITLCNVVNKTVKIESIYGISFGSGLLLTLGFDEKSYNDSGFYILGDIIRRLFNSTTPINSVLETKLQSNERGQIAQWNAM
ncbi:MAG: type VI secretion system baseplate subunit TssF [bacterium]|nr:type VI secretion system baseplate subunit TssF [bacterium]